MFDKVSKEDLISMLPTQSISEEKMKFVIKEELDRMKKSFEETL